MKNIQEDKTLPPIVEHSLGVAAHVVLMAIEQGRLKYSGDGIRKDFILGRGQMAEVYVILKGVKVCHCFTAKDGDMIRCRTVGQTFYCYSCGRRLSPEEDQ